jgi:hypothetical protein
VSALLGWSQEGATEEELRLLEASRRERPDPSALARTLVALGVGGAPHGAPRPDGALAGRASTASKLVMLALVGGAGIAGVAWFKLRHQATGRAIAAAVSAPAVPSLAPPPRTEPVAPSPFGAVAGGSVKPPPAVGRERPHHVPARRAAHAAPTTAPPSLPEPARPVEVPVAVSTLSAEVAALEQAHAALAARDAEAALFALDRYRARFPAGRLASEETVLRIQALLARGDGDAANALASRFFAAHPESSYADRVRDLLQDAGEKQKQK